MATPKVSLLGLPRELRNMIYDHLAKELRFPYGCDKHLDGDRCLCAKSVVEVHNAPLPGVLLTNSQIYYEYLEAECYKALRISIHIGMVSTTLSSEAGASKTTIQLTRATLARARHVTMFLDAMRLHTLSGNDLWARVVLLTKAVTARTNKMSVLRLAIHRHDEDVEVESSHFDFLAGVIPFPADRRRNFMPSPPSSLNGLPLIQRGEGYRLRPEDALEVRSIVPHSSDHHHIIAGRDWVVYHAVVKAGVYIYSSEQNSTSYWIKQDVVDEWKLPNGQVYLKYLQPASDDEKAKIQNLPYEIREWKEKRGNEVTTWDVDGDEGDT
jgi:hypothetical protein